MPKLKKLTPALLVMLVIAAYQWLTEGTVPNVASFTESAAPTASASNELRAGQQTRGSGKVVRILSDDNEGSRHQRFILELGGGRTVLVAHNIDVAPRVAGLRTGDTVEYYGVYETNDRGGVIHWTHHDPQGRHTDGWLEHDGRRYE